MATPPFVAPGNQIPPPGQDQQQAQPPSWKKILLGMVPIAGPMLVAHGQQEYERKKQIEDQTIQAKQAPLALATHYAMLPAGELDPDTQLGWQQLQADLALHNEENYTQKYKPEHIKQFRELLGKTNQQMAMKRMQEQGNVPQALLPPPGSQPQQPAQAGIPGMLPQGAGPARVNVPPGGPPPQAASQAPMSILPPPGAPQQQQDDPIIQLHQDAQSPNPLVRGPALNLIREMRTSVIKAESLVRQGQSMIDAYQQSGASKIGIPYSQFVETIQGKAGGVTAAPLVMQHPGETALSATGTPLGTAPMAVTTPDGGTSTMVTPTPVAAGQSTLPPPPGSSVIASSPPKLNDAQTKAIDAARIIAKKYGVPFDPSKNPGNPSAQIPDKYLEEMRAQEKRLSENPELTASLLGMRSAMEGIRALTAQATQQRVQEFNATHSPQAIDALGRMVLSNPDTFHELNDTGVKSLVSQWLMKQGLPAPRKLDMTTQQGESNAHVALGSIAKVKEMLDDPVIKKNIGPILGRLGSLEQGMGDTIHGLSDADLQKVQDFRTSLNYLFFQEGKALFGGRPPQKLMEEFKKTSANPNMVMPILQGSLNAAERAANQRVNVAMSQRFGGKVPPGYKEAGASTANPPPIPATLTAADKGKVYLSKSGKKLKITDVNPADGTQFKSQEVP